MPITALYAALLALLYVMLSVRVIRARRGAGVAIGDGGEEQLRRRIRVHANFAEYVPLALILIALAESMKSSAVILHALGLALLIGRAIHAFGVSRTPEWMALRVLGMSLTFVCLVGGALLCLVGAFASTFG